MPPASSIPAPEELRVDLATMRRRSEDRRLVEVTLPEAWLGSILADTDAELPNPGQVTLTVSLQPAGIVLAQGRLELGLTVPCGRCLTPADVDGSADLLATFLPAAEAARRLQPPQGSAQDADQDADQDEDEDGIVLHEEDLDTWSYEGTVLQLSPLISEFVRLAYPMRALCERGEGCRGLCSNCGAALNPLPPAALICAECNAAVPATPLADPAPKAASEPKKVGSLASALIKAGIDPKA